MQRPDDQATVKRKWSADKSAGPLVLLAEWLQKRLIQHGWPCEYDRLTSVELVQDQPEENARDVETVLGVTFRAMRGRPPCSEHFWDAFDAVLRVVTHEKRLRAYRDGANLHLDGDYHVNKYGVIKCGPLPPPF